MKSLLEIIEGLKIGSKTNVNTYKYFPKSTDELKKIIKKLIEDGVNNLNVIDTSSINDMKNLFDDLDIDKKIIKNIQINKWNMSNVKSTRNMFMGCENFNSSLSGWDVSNVEDMSGMFYKCKTFNQDISNWDVSNVRNMSEMFEGCISFNQDISNWKMDNVKNIDRMFYNCKDFKCDLSDWNISNCSMEDTFTNKSVLLNLPDWYDYDEED